MAETKRGASTTIWIFSLLLAALFLFTGVQKILGIGDAPQHFADWGYPAWFRTLIGFIEVGGGLALLIPSVAVYAVTALTVVMLGAIYTHLTKAAPGVAIPIVCLILLGIIGSQRRRTALTNSQIR